MEMDSRLAIASAGLLVLIYAGGADAAERFPSRPVRMIVPFSPGGATDVPGRILAAKLSALLGEQVVVDNRPGAGGTIGMETVARANPDGYTILMTATPFVISTNLYKNLPFDPLKDFAPIAQFGSAPNVLIVHPSLGVASVAELVTLARKQPGKIDYASSGNGSAQHLFGALFLSTAGIEMMHVPYKGSGPATADLLGGQVKVGFPGIAIALQHHKAGRLRALGVTTAKRSPQMPDVPSIAESGVPGYDATSWLGLAAPKATPKSIVASLHKEIARAMSEPDVRAAFLKTGTDPITTTPEQYGAFVAAEYAKWGRVIRAIGLKAN
jgi:tripartite-type tricarboxylate transporter receptor subunit TctC